MPFAPSFVLRQAATHFKITLLRSSIGLHPTVRSTVTSLGFKRRMQTVYQPINGESIGKLVKVKELVRVESVSGERMEEELRPRVRAEQKGYTVVGRAL